MLKLLFIFEDSTLYIYLKTLVNCSVITSVNLLLPSQRAVGRLGLSPGCMGLCPSTGPCTSLFRKSPRWWETPTLRRSQTMRVNHTSKPRDFCSSSLLFLTISLPVAAADSLDAHAAITLTKLGGVSSHGRQLALQAVHSLHQGGVGRQEPRQLQPELGRVLVHQLADLTQDGPGHRLHDGGELRVKSEAARHHRCGL